MGAVVEEQASDADPPVYAGIEAGGTSVVCAVGSGPARCSEPVTIPTTTPHQTLERVIDALRAQGPVDGIGVAAFGPLDLHAGSPTFGYVTSTPKPGWGDTDLVGPLRAAFGVPVAIDTDVNGAALGEWRWGAGADVDSLVYVTVGTGVGVGVLVDGEPLHGLLHPEAGHLPVRRHPDDDLAGVCPFHGDCLEGLASGPAIAQRWGRDPRELGVHRDDAVALEAVYLAQLVVAVTYVLSPTRVVLGGGVLHLPGLLDAVRERTLALLNGYLAVPAITEAVDRYVVAPGLGDRAGVLGAIALAQRAAGRER